MHTLTDKEIEQALKNLPHWHHIDDTLVTIMEFEDFHTAMEFVTDVAMLAEEKQHHPNILIEYKKVTLELSTHDVDAITDKDISMAHDIDALCDSHDAENYYE